MLIFEKFATRTQAEDFAGTVERKYGLGSYVYDTQEEMEGWGAVDNGLEAWAAKHDVFPCVLEPPIVLVTRTDWEDEDDIRELVKKFGGVFAGT